MNQFALVPRLHHIGVQTSDLANSLAWYRDFLGCRPTWSTEDFSELTRSRLPGVLRLAEVAVGDLRFHLFERDSRVARQHDTDRVQFQHVCVSTESVARLRAWRDRWLELSGSGRYVFLRDSPPTDIVVDEEGTHSFYCIDVNGLEFEFTYVPEAAP